MLIYSKGTVRAGSLLKCLHQLGPGLAGASIAELLLGLLYKWVVRTKYWRHHPFAPRDTNWQNVGPGIEGGVELSYPTGGVGVLSDVITAVPNIY